MEVSIGVSFPSISEPTRRRGRQLRLRQAASCGRRVDWPRPVSSGARPAGVRDSLLRRGTEPAPARQLLHICHALSTPRQPSSSKDADGYLPEATVLQKTQRVLVAVDDSELSEAALQWAVKNLLRKESDELRLLHVVPGQRFEETCAHSYEASATSISIEEEPQVFPLPHEALQESWATPTMDYLQTRFLSKLQDINIGYEVDLVKEYGPNTPSAIGRCICDTSERVAADVIVIAQRSCHCGVGCGSVSNFVAHYANRPVIVLNEQQLELFQSRLLGHDPAEKEAHLEPQNQWVSSINRARYPSITELCGSQGSRVLVFAVDRELNDTWSVDWALETIYREGDEVHLVHVARRKSPETEWSLKTACRQFESLGITAVEHLVVQTPEDPGDDADNCESIGKMLVRLTQELDAQMLFLVDYSDSNLQEFLKHSIPGQCLQSRTCPSVLLHTRAGSATDSSCDDLSA